MSGHVLVNVFEQHPGYGEWGRHWAERRGFTLDENTPDQLSRGTLKLAVRPMKDDHLVIGDDEYIVSYVQLFDNVTVLEAYVRFNGKSWKG